MTTPSLQLLVFENKESEYGIIRLSQISPYDQLSQDHSKEDSNGYIYMLVKGRELSSMVQGRAVRANDDHHYQNRLVRDL